MLLIQLCVWSNAASALLIQLSSTEFNWIQFSLMPLRCDNFDLSPYDGLSLHNFMAMSIAHSHHLHVNDCALSIAPLITPSATTSATAMRHSHTRRGLRHLLAFLFVWLPVCKFLRCFCHHCVFCLFLLSLPHATAALAAVAAHSFRFAQASTSSTAQWLAGAERPLVRCCAQ